MKLRFLSFQYEDGFRFSVFEVNLQTRELRQETQKVNLQGQPFQVLAALFEVAVAFWRHAGSGASAFVAL